MMESIIASSTLILVVVLLRHFLKGRISLRLQYALWFLVLVRLVIPFSLPESPISVMNAVETVVKVRQEGFATFMPKGTGPADMEGTVEDTLSPGAAPVTKDETTGSRHNVFPWGLLVKWVWYAGVGVVGLCFVSSNLILGKKLTKSRTRYRVNDYKLPIYKTKEVPSPCLFGIFYPAVYITPEVFEDEIGLRHVLVHELTHYRHGDHIWSALRCLCLALHWYNPLVWLAAVLSRRDAELACDESAIDSLGEENRGEYGRTLIDLTCESQNALDLLCYATTMTEGRRGIKERIMLIAKRPRRLVPAVIAVLIVAAVASACTFTGAKNGIKTVPLTAEELEGYNVMFETPSFYEDGYSKANPFSHFVRPYYDKPENLNLAQFLQYYPSDEIVENEAEFQALKAAENWPFDADMVLANMIVPIHKFHAVTVDEVLKNYMGIRRDDLSGVGQDELIYLKEYDAYYNFTSDMAFGFFVSVSGERQGDIVRLYSENAVLTLKEKGHSFLFVSHQPIEEEVVGSPGLPDGEKLAKGPFANSTGNIYDYMPRLLSGESVSDYEILPTLEGFTHGIWIELERAYTGKPWFNVLWETLDHAAVSEDRGEVDEQSFRNYYVGKAYLSADGAYSEGLADIVMKQWEYDSLGYSNSLEENFSPEESSLLRQCITFGAMYWRDDPFCLHSPSLKGGLCLFSYPLDFPFGDDLEEISRNTYRAESFGQVTEIECAGLQVKYLDNGGGVYLVFSLRANKQGYKSLGIAVGDTEGFLLANGPRNLKELDRLSYDDEDWFGQDYDRAYAYTPEKGTKSVVFVVKDNFVTGIEVINGLDGPTY